MYDGVSTRSSRVDSATRWHVARERGRGKRGARRVPLAQTASQLEAIVVTGTPGSAERRTLGNAVAQLDVSDLRRKSNVNITDVLQARAPGVQIEAGSGTVGRPPTFAFAAPAVHRHAADVYIDGVRMSTAGLGNFDPSGQGLRETAGARAATRSTSSIRPISSRSKSSGLLPRRPCTAPTRRPASSKSSPRGAPAGSRASNGRPAPTRARTISDRRHRFPRTTRRATPRSSPRRRRGRDARASRSAPASTATSRSATIRTPCATAPSEPRGFGAGRQRPIVVLHLRRAQLRRGCPLRQLRLEELAPHELRVHRGREDRLSGLGRDPGRAASPAARWRVGARPVVRQQSPASRARDRAAGTDGAGVAVRDAGSVEPVRQRNALRIAPRSARRSTTSR